MKAEELRLIIDKATIGAKLATKKLITLISSEDGELVVMKEGKIVRVKARDLK